MSIIENYQNSVLGVFGKPQLVVSPGLGSEVWDENNKRYIDLLGGIAVNSLGHCHPQIVEEIGKQAGQIIHHSNFFTNQKTVQLAQKLLEISKAPKDSKVFFTNSGTESNECALKIVKKHLPQGRIIALSRSFHGRSLGALSITSKEQYRSPFEPLIPNVQFIEANNLDQLELTFSDLSIERDGPIAGMFIECIQGEAGVQPLSAQFIARARELTRRHNALLVIDEVQTGIGRTGTWFSFQNPAVVASAHIEPDLITIAKSLGAGIPIGALIANGKQSANILTAGNHGTTFGGNPLVAAVALKNLEVIESEGLLQRSSEIAPYIARKVLDFNSDKIVEIRGAGALVGLQLKPSDSCSHPAVKVAEMCLQNGVIVNAVTSDSLRFAPAYNIDVDLLDEALNVVFENISNI
jgi:acetylornithine aminotransferase